MTEFEKLDNKLSELEKLKNELKLKIETRYDCDFEFEAKYDIYHNKKGIVFEVKLGDCECVVYPKEMKKLGEWLRDLGLLD